MSEEPRREVRHGASTPDPPPGPAKRRLVVAEVEPLDVTGTRTVTIGTIAWAVAFVALLPFYGTLRDDGNLWWLWTCVAGFGLGLLGWAYCHRREQHLRHEPRQPESSPFGAAGL